MSLPMSPPRDAQKKIDGRRVLPVSSRASVVKNDAPAATKHGKHGSRRFFFENGDIGKLTNLARLIRGMGTLGDSGPHPVERGRAGLDTHTQTHTDTPFVLQKPARCADRPGPRRRAPVAKEPPPRKHVLSPQTAPPLQPPSSSPNNLAYLSRSQSLRWV